jgi:PAS domain S-box-containing protein
MKLSSPIEPHQPPRDDLLSHSDRRLPFLLEFTPLIIYVARASPDYGATFVSENVTAQMGYTPDQFIVQPDFWLQRIHPEDVPRVLDSLSHLFETDHHQLEYRFRFADGSYHWMLDEAQLLRDAANQPLEIVGYWLDITERKRMETQLQENELQLTTIFREAPTIIGISTLAEGRYLEVNDAFVRVTGYRRDQVIGHTALEIGIYQNPEDRIRLRQIIREQGFARNLEITLRGKSGQTIYSIISAQPVRYQGQPCLLTVANDITERKQAEEELRQSNRELQARNEELDAFAHTVAHDLKNPAHLIMGNAELLAEAWADIPDKDRCEALQSIARNGRKLGTIIDELLLFAGLRQVEAKIEPLDMPGIVTESLNRLTDMIQHTQAEIVIQQATDWPVALGYSWWLEEVWANYLNNALNYGGRPPRIEIGAEPQPDGFVRFWVRDNGHGLTPEEQARLFVPFTRLQQLRVKGHGLGLSIVRRIVEKLGGQVSVSSTVGAGSTFYFTLPAADHK